MGSEKCENKMYCNGKMWESKNAGLLQRTSLDQNLYKKKHLKVSTLRFHQNAGLHLKQS